MTAAKSLATHTRSPSVDGDINDNVQISHFLLVGWTNLKDITIFVVSTVHKSSIVYYNVKDTVNDTNPHESQQNEFVGVFVKKKKSCFKSYNDMFET